MIQESRVESSSEVVCRTAISGMATNAWESWERLLSASLRLSRKAVETESKKEMKNVIILGKKAAETAKNNLYGDVRSS